MLRRPMSSDVFM